MALLKSEMDEDEDANVKKDFEMSDDDDVVK